MTLEDYRGNSPLEEQNFGVILLVPLFTVSKHYFNVTLNVTVKLRTNCTFHFLTR
jgi:hypothetical protein